MLVWVLLFLHCGDDRVLYALYIGTMRQSGFFLFMIFLEFVHFDCDYRWEAETNQELIMAQGGIGLLARTADDAEDPQTLRMVAGAIANLCGNGILFMPLIALQSILQPVIIKIRTFQIVHNVLFLKK